MSKSIAFAMLISLLLQTSIFSQEKKNPWAELLKQPTIEDYTKLLEEEGPNKSVYRKRASLWYAQKEFDKAIEDYNAAMAIGPATHHDYRRRANCWWAKNNFEKALEDLTTAIKLSPNSVKNYENRAELYERHEYFEKAAADVTELIRIQPDYVLHYRKRGMLWMEADRYDEAIKDIEKGLSFEELSNPMQSDFHMLLGIAHSVKKEFTKSIASHREAISLSPAAPGSYIYLAKILAMAPDVKHRNGEEALKLARKACSLTDWKDDLAIQALAAAYGERRDFENALKWGNQAIELARDERKKKDAKQLVEFFKVKMPARYK